ncbi:hypothetical protein KRE43_05530 [Elizabethkingia meningoseptica]|uniref:hypothetical protein n=1 Tax=Elizabethkingia meningoseptica TaxID=238 RepID=UPI0023AEBC76|nr:hypothetical protein [Elizabethkingia meningoseptica]MDE5525885.1 hypothetical protein [Elizabethkingia meningoseptica]MDE5529414.1 hypothetical protein [Elizabethkingia meningoseptica]MDE5532970.1 hypothetical protein [Elizabethkingia meningoseptica]MDE5541303.1 hypothetical protein [Elizabethkingia meningoseptica]
MNKSNKNNTSSISWETMLIIGVVVFIAYIFNKSKWNLDNLFKNILSLEWWKGLFKGNVTTNPTTGGSSDGTLTEGNASGTPVGTKKKTNVVAGNLEIINQDVDNRFTYAAKYFTDREYFGSGIIPNAYRSNFSVLLLQLDRIREAWGSSIKITKGYQQPSSNLSEAFYNGFNLCLAVNIVPTIGKANDLLNMISTMMQNNQIVKGTIGVTSGQVYIHFSGKYKNLG